MSKFLITADVHCGIPGRLRDSLWALETMRSYARQQGIHHVFVCGDLFHDRVNLNLEVLGSVYDFFEETAEKWGQQWLAFPGNHDMFLRNSWKINSVRPLGRLLQAVSGVSVLSVGDARVSVLPFIQDEDEYLEALAKLEKDCTGEEILLTHVGIHGAILNACFLLQNWSKITFDGSKFAAIFAGHFHCHQRVGTRVWVPGSPISFRHDDGMKPHGFLIWEDGEVRFVDIYTAAGRQDWHPPRHLTYADAELTEAVAQAPGNSVRIALSRDYTTNELNQLREQLHDAGAKSVQWIHPKEQKAVAQSVSGLKVNLRDHDSTLTSWLQFDKPEGYSEPMLRKLNEMIAKEAEEQLVTAGLSDAEEET